MEILTICLSLAAAVLVLVLRTLWGSQLFWWAALALTVVFFPLTGGWSSTVFLGILVIRLVVLRRAPKSEGESS